MSAATASSTDTVFVRLVGESVDVWRPVVAASLGGGVYRLDPAPVPDDEAWEFQPGDTVHVAIREGENGPIKIVRSIVPAETRRAGHIR